MDTTNWVTTLNSTLKALLAGNSSQFLSFGLAISGGLAIILIARYGITTALSGRGFDFGDFFNEVLLLVATCLCLLKGYSTPLPVFADRTFPDLIIDGPAQLANQITLASNQQLDDLFKTALLPENKPISSFDVGALISYWIMRMFIEGTRGIMFAVTAFGYAAQAILVLLGPIFIPFLLFKPLSFMFWGWFKSLLQYSFYPLVCACFSSVLSSLFMNLYTSQANGTLTVPLALSMIPIFLIIMISMLSVPLVVSSLFSGSTAAVALRPRI
jgi:hypothetical protein